MRLAGWCLSAFYKINLIDEYNNKMNAVDVSDQLCNNYCMTHWLRQRKWWWSIFLWGMGVLLTNAYKCYTRVMDSENVPQSQRLTHYDFLLSIATAWIDRGEDDIRHIARLRARKRKRELNPIVVSPEPTHGHGTRGRSPCPKSPLPSSERPHKATRLNENTLHPQTGSLRCQLDHFGCFHSPIPSDSKDPSCAMHRWLLGRDAGSCSQVRANILCCSACHVNLCAPCFNLFHTIQDIVKAKLDLAAKLVKS